MVLLLTEEEQEAMLAIMRELYPGMVSIVEKFELTDTMFRTKTRGIPGGPYTVEISVKPNPDNG